MPDHRPISTVTLPGGEAVPALGLGTWRMGEVPARRAGEIAALRHGIELGMTLVDTAEMYGEGATETLLGEALAGLREKVFLVSKAYPYHAGRDTLPAACEASLRRLRTDRLDLFLLHWPGSVPLAETVEAMERLRQSGKIRHWGVSNFDADDMDALVAAGGESCGTDQVLYNLMRRGPEHDLLPWLRQRSIPTMAYSPVEQGRLTSAKALAQIASRLGATPAQVALAWLLAQPGVIVIPKAGRRRMSRRTAPRPACGSRPRTWPSSTGSFRRLTGRWRWRCCERPHRRSRHIWHAPTGPSPDPRFASAGAGLTRFRRGRNRDFMRWPGR